MNSIENSVASRNLQERIGKLCLSKQWSDCVFKINSSCIYAHRLILASASPVFEVMLYGALAEVKHIVIYDIDQKTFEAMLYYIYTDKSNISSVGEACHLLYASNKYMLKTLQTLCKTYIMKNLSISNALEILDFAKAIDDAPLIQAGMQMVCAHVRHVFDETDYHPSVITMLEIVQQDNMNSSEIDLFNILIQWCERECDVQNQLSTKENVCALLMDSGILTHIRFLTLNRNDINNLIETSNVISDDVMESFITDNHLLQNDKSMAPRKDIKLTWRYSVCQYFKSAYPLWIDANNLSTQAVVVSSKTVLINSFRVSSRLTPPDIQLPYKSLPSTTYNEKIIVQVMDNLGNLVVCSVFSLRVEYNDNINIDLHRPIVLRCKEAYTIKFSWSPEEISSISAQYPQQFVSDIGSKNGVLFSIRNQEATFLCGISYTL